MMFTQLYRNNINLIRNIKYHLYKNLIKSSIGVGVLFIGYMKDYHISYIL